jgi:hypothetical protein
VVTARMLHAPGTGRLVISSTGMKPWAGMLAITVHASFFNSFSELKILEIHFRF